MFGEKVNAIINEYAGKEALGIKFISEPEDTLTIFANVFKESPFSFSYSIRSIGYCERQIAEYNLTTKSKSPAYSTRSVILSGEALVSPDKTGNYMCLSGETSVSPDKVILKRKT